MYLYEDHTIQKNAACLIAMYYTITIRAYVVAEYNKMLVLLYTCMDNTCPILRTPYYAGIT